MKPMNEIIASLLGALALSGALGCGSSDEGGADDGRYAFLSATGLSGEQVQEAWAGLPYSTIRLERKGCYGTCPIYNLELNRGSGTESEGPAAYHGVAYTTREGHYSGNIGLWDYGRLCQLLDRYQFMNLDEEYSADATDLSGVTIQAERLGNVHRVLDYGNQGGPDLVALQLSIDAIGDRIEWTASP